MATEVIKIVDPDNGSGTNYTSLSAWEAGEQGDLTGARDEIAVAKCRCTGGTADAADGDNVAIEGWTTDSTHYIKIWTDPTESYRHPGSWSDSKYRLTKNADGSGPLVIKESYVYIIGLQISTNSYSGRDWSRGVFVESGNNIYVLQCIIKKAGSNANHIGILCSSGAGTGQYYCNNIIYGFSGASESGIYLDNEGGTQLAYAYNNTISGCNTGIISGRWKKHDIINNIISSCTEAFSGSFNRSYNNATNNASLGTSYDAATESGNHTSHTFSFVGVEDFHLQSSDTGAKGLGLNLYNDANYPFQTDIDGDDRGGSGAVWDIGADEYVTTTYNESLTYSAAGAMSLGTQATFGSSLTLGAAGAMAQAGPLTMSADLTFTAAGALTDQGPLTMASDITLPSSGAISLANTLTSNPDISLSALASLADEAGLTTSPTISLSGIATLESLLSRTTYQELILTADGQIAASLDGTIYIESISLGTLADLVINGTCSFGDTLDLSASAGLAHDSQITAQDLIGLAASATMPVSSLLETITAVTLTAAASMAQSVLGVYLGEVTLAAASDFLTSLGPGTSNVVTTLSALADMGLSGTGILVASATLAAAAGLIGDGVIAAVLGEHDGVYLVVKLSDNLVFMKKL